MGRQAIPIQNNQAASFVGRVVPRMSTRANIDVIEYIVDMFIKEKKVELGLDWWFVVVAGYFVSIFAEHMLSLESHWMWPSSQLFAVSDQFLL